MTTVKLFVDGVIEGGTGALLEPYCALAHDASSGGGHGISNWNPGELAEACAAFDAAGFQLHLHAIGDRAVRDALDAFEHVDEVNGPRDRRPVTPTPTSSTRTTATGSARSGRSPTSNRCGPSRTRSWST
jgi:predicted amidohydrolase YtcJ